MISRRGFFGLVAGFLAAPRARISKFAGLFPGRNYSVPFHLPTELAKMKMCRPLPLPTENLITFYSYPFHTAQEQREAAMKCVIGSYADYYSEHDGMVEIGPGCRERLDARIAAGPETAEETAARNPREPIMPAIAARFMS